MFKSLDIKVKDTVFDPKLTENKVHVQGIGTDKPMYKVWIYLIGKDLPYVKSVTYELHPTFTDPIKRVERSSSNPKCTLIIWTWGIFTVKASVEDKRGTKHKIDHFLKYGEQLKNEKYSYV